MTKSLWAQYREELDGSHVIEIDRAFIAFRVFPDHVYISDCFVHPDLRKSGIAARLVEKVRATAHDLKKPWIVSCVDLTTNVHSQSLAAQLGVGLVPFCTEEGKIWLRKPTDPESERG